METYSPAFNRHSTTSRNRFSLTGLKFLDSALRVRRKVQNGATLAKWHWDAGDIRPLPDEVVDGYAEGPALPQAPVLVKGDLPHVYLLDNGVKRHVKSARVLSAWGWAAGEVQTRTPAEISAIPLGPPVFDYPHVVKGSGATVYLLDVSP